MIGLRRERILEALLASPGSQGTSRRLCEVCAEITDMTGAGIMLMSGEMPRGSLCNTNTVSAGLEQLQYTLGEGPCIDAFQHDHFVLEPDLVASSSPRWPAFSRAAIDAGVEAIFALPLRVGAVRIGALDLYRDRPGPLSDEQHADALVMADVAAEAVLVLQASAEPGMLAEALEAGSNFHHVVHQAAGMVAAQLDESVGHALIRLRARAFATTRSLEDVARDVVARNIRFDPASDR